MPLSNLYFDELLRSYDEKRRNAVRERDRRREAVYAALPEAARIDEEIASAAIRAARSRIAHREENSPSLSDTIERLKAKRAALLAAAGFPPDALEIRYECPLCQDTGFIDGKKCVCFREAETALLYDRYHLGNILEKENFAHFSFDWYSDTIIDEKTGCSARIYAQDAYEKARRTAERIGTPDNNLFIHGNTGLGKTFLTHCIAKEALDRSVSALYFTASELVSLLSDAAFGRGEFPGFSDRMVLGCDLLIIDDLGTELTNSFVNSQLFRCINERILHDRSTVISTNLSLEEFRETYSERIFSRVISHYSIVKLIGSDIRLQKKRLTGGTT